MSNTGCNVPPEEELLPTPAGRGLLIYRRPRFQRPPRGLSPCGDRRKVLLRQGRPAWGGPGGLLGGFRRLVQGFQTGFQVFFASLDRRDVLLGDGFLETRYLVFYFTLEVCGQLVPHILKLALHGEAEGVSLVDGVNFLSAFLVFFRASASRLARSISSLERPLEP